MKFFLQYLNAQPQQEKDRLFLDLNNFKRLFSLEPVFTKDYEEKLFRLNKYTAITTTGIAEINDKKIESIVREFIGTQEDIEDLGVGIDQRITQFTDYVVGQIKEHLCKYNRIGECTFIITFYERSTHSTHIYKVITNELDDSVPGNQDFQYLSIHKELDWVKVVCDGQNKLSDNILYGIGKSLYDAFPRMINHVLGTLNLQEGAVPEGFIDSLLQDDLLKGIFLSDIELLNLSDLSLQQAVDLASLLMRLEVDFQKYTKNIPTVGGVIKLAKIDDEGFEFISGHEINKPKHINV